MFRLPDPRKKRKKGTKGQKHRRDPIILAREWKEALDGGGYVSRADLARKMGISRARVTQILNLLKLDPEVQEVIVRLGDPLASPVVTERGLRAIVGLSVEKQNREVQKMLTSQQSPSSSCR